MNNLIGQQIDNYRIETLLGEGGMGAVYRARDVNLNRLAAIKVMNRRLARDPEFQHRFLQEAQAAARLKHPSIVQIYHFNNRQGLLYMAMAFVPGQTLGTYIRRLKESKRVILLPESLTLTAQIAEALGYAHRQGVVHRDIKPDNVMLEALDVADREGEPAIRAVVTDFGLAKLLEGGMETQTNTIMGTLPYMSPEQCRGRNIDGRSDIYSLGILLFQLVTGRLPFEIKSIGDAAEKHIRQQPPSPLDIRPELPAAVAVIVLKAIAKRPEDRFQTGEELARALRRVNVTAAVEEVVTEMASVTAVVSLVTELMPDPDMVEVPSLGPSVLAPSEADVLIVQRKGEPNRTVTLEKATMIIGRSPQNDIVLDAPGVSRQHARLERSTMGWQLIDLGSSNGTWVKSSQLLPNIPEPWEAGQPARFGPFVVQWRPGAGTVVQPPKSQWTPTRSGQTGVTQLLTMDGMLGISVSAANVSVKAGGQAAVQIELANQGVVVDHFYLRVEGIPAEWVTITPEPVQLMPERTASLPFSLHPPRHSSATAGRHPFKLIIQSQATKQVVAAVDGSVTVEPFAQFATEAQPTQLVNEGICRVTVRNEGNSPAAYRVSARDNAEALHFTGERSSVSAPPGKTAEVLLKVQAKDRPLTGSKLTYPIQIRVQAEAGERQIHQGVLAVKPRFPTWLIALIPIAAILCCISGVFGANYWNTNNERNRQTATAIAWATSAAKDDDGDGLSNAQEAQLGTNANNSDSDGDGLLDGDEQTWGTDPLVADSDGDTLPDGREVHELCSSPINPDTDGDSLPDNVDSDPCQLPTPTQPPTNTPLPTAIPSPTSPPPDTATPTHIPPTAISTPTHTNTPTPTFTPTPSSTPTPPPVFVVSSGVINIPQTWSVDLEAGELDSSENSDIWFEADTATERFITPRNGALIAAVVLTGEIQVEDCAEAPFFTTRIDINTLAVGSYVCVQTNSGNYAVIRLDAAVGPSPGTLTVTYTVWAAGNLAIPQTWTVDLDTGLIGAGSLADIWFEAVTETERYVTPRNGAQIAAVGTTSLRRDGCAAVSLADSRIHINALPPGTYVCVRTNQGHYSEFRVNEAVGPSPGTLNISYSTSE